MLPRTLEIEAVFPPVEPSKWRALVEQDLKGAPFERKLVTHTYEGLYIQPLYTRADSSRAERDEGAFSGLGGMTRGAGPLGSGAAGWDMRQERAEADPDQAGAAIREDLEGGVTSIVVRLDACARSGLDPTDPAGAELAARDGIALYTLDDLDRLLSGVHLEMAPVWLEAGAAFMPAAGMLAALWRRRGIPPHAVRGGFQADPLAVLAREGSLPYPLADGLARMAELAAWTDATYPGVRAVRVGTAAYHHAGATATQDLAFSMASGLEYLRAMTGAGLSLEAATRQMTFSFAVGCGLFLAMAKLRAARRLWARVIEACDGSEDAARMSMYVRPSKRVLTVRDPWVNMLRNTVCVFAAGAAGADAIASTPYDATLGDPSAAARRLARNTHHLLMEESHLHRVCDPAGGSWYVEHLTGALCERAWVILQAIESRGGMARALRDGWIGSQIDTASQPRIRNIATRKDVVVGVSDFPDAGEANPARAPTDRVRVVEAVLRRRRPPEGTETSPAPPPPGHTMAWIMRRALAGDTIGRISAGLHDGGGVAEHLAAAIHVHPFAEPFERMRAACDEYAESCGEHPRVFLAAIGTPARRLARVNFSRNLFEAGGFEVLGGEGDGTIAGTLADFAQSAAGTAVICGADEHYPLVVPQLAPALHRAGARRVILAGNPGAQESVYRAAGVDRFVFVRCDVVSLLSELLHEEGVTP